MSATINIKCDYCNRLVTSKLLYNRGVDDVLTALESMGWYVRWQGKEPIVCCDNCIRHMPYVLAALIRKGEL